VSPESPYFQVHLPNPVEIDQSLDLGYHTKDVLCLQQDESNP
jgi:hypothetical protein